MHVTLPHPSDAAAAAAAFRDAAVALRYWRRFTFTVDHSTIFTSSCMYIWSVIILRSKAIGPNLFSKFYENSSTVFSESSLYAVVRPSVVCCLSVTLVHPSQAVVIFRNISFYGIWYHGHPLTFTENFTQIVPGNPSVGGVKHKRGSKI